MKHLIAPAVLAVCAPAFGGGSFVNWESPHVSPLDLTPDGTKLLAVNTADDRLEVFAVTVQGLIAIGSVPTGLDPVSVRARSDSEAWVVNHVSDSVSVVDLVSMNVVATLHPGDEPADVVFAGSPQRAFVSVSQLNQVKVYDPENLAAAPVTIAIEGEDPRALATDGVTVYAAIFESGNRTSVLAQTVVSSAVNPYAGDANPPPNFGTAFDPPILPNLPAAPDVSLIVKKVGPGDWRDDNTGNWSAAVSWDLHDHDVAIIDASTLVVTYATGVMNLNMALGMRPGGGVTVVGTDAINHVRFEPNVVGIFVQVLGATVTGPGAAGAAIDLNPHLDYTSATVAQGLRDQSVGDPRGIAWKPDGSVAYITGMGSNNLLVVNGALGRTGLVEVGEGPTGVRYDAALDRVYVLDKFEGAISVVNAAQMSEMDRVSYYDPTPAAIQDGRPFLYDTHRTSGLGQAACASCHIDGRMDQLAWDLGNPQGEVKPFNQVCNFGLGGCENWHPMKGPMTTQTLVGIIGTEPFHWRGDREGLSAFNPAFEVLMGDDVQLTDQEMAQFEAFVATLTPPPNPHRNLNGTLPSTFFNGGNPQLGQSLFLTGGLDLINCVTCHVQPSGTNGQLTSGNLLQETQSIKIPQLRNMHEKTGFSLASLNNNRGFGFIHDGSVESLFAFLQFSGFNFAAGATGNQQRRNVEAFLFCFATDTHAGVGAQVTLPAVPGGPTTGDLFALASSGSTGLVAKGLVAGEHRGYYRTPGGTFQSDRAAESLSQAALLALAGAGAEITLTAVPVGSQLRIGVDRDEDGYFDGDEIDAGSDPANPSSTPKNVVVGDLNGDGVVNTVDFLALLQAWGLCPAPPVPCAADLDGDNDVGITDFLLLLQNWS